MKADSTDLAAFKARGGKLVHRPRRQRSGVLDPRHDQLVERPEHGNGGRAAEVARLFAVPGMNHCAGGPSTDQYDAFGALVNWVEKGARPIASSQRRGRRHAVARPNAAAVRLPRQARYKAPAASKTPRTSRAGEGAVGQWRRRRSHERDCHPAAAPATSRCHHRSARI